MARIKEPYVKVTERVREYPTLLNIDGTSILAGVVVSPKGRDLQYISGPRDFLDKMVGADELPRDSHISLINAFYCSYFSGLVLARSMDKTGGVTFMHKLGGDTSSWVTLPILEGQVINTTAILTWSLGFTENDKWAFEMNGTTFYHGLTEAEYNAVVPTLYGVTGPKAAVSSLSEIASIISSWTGFLASVDNNKIEMRFNSPVDSTEGDVKDMIGLNANYFIRTTDAETEVESDSIQSIGNLVKVDSVQLDGNFEDYISIELKDSSMYNYRFVFSGSGPDYTLNIYSDDSVSSLIGSFKVSLDPMGIDEEGNSNFIENLNSQFEDIKFTVANDERLVITGLDLGEVKMSEGDHEEFDIDIKKSAEPKYMSAAAYRLANQSRYAIDYLSDFGVTTSSFLKDLIYIGKENFWFAPADIPYTYTNSAAIKMFGDGISNTNQTMVFGPFDKNSSFLGYPCKIACSSLYYERVFMNKSNGSEFAPVFEQTNGVLAYHEPACQLSDSDREALLNASNGPINFVIFDHATNLYYLNDNRCHTTTEDILSEECTRRLINKINRDVKQIMNRFKGRVNDNETRAEVESTINLYISQNIMNQNYKPDEMKAICDKTNNTDDIIVAHKMAVTVKSRLYGSTKFIDILSDVYPIGVDFVA